MAADLLVIVCAAAVLLLPGALLLGVSGLARAIPAYLHPAAALTFSTMIIALLLVPSLLLRVGVFATLGAVAIVALVIVGAATVARAMGAPPERRGAAAGELLTSLAGAPLRSLLAMHPSVVALGFASALLAFLVRGEVRNDALFHANLALKLWGLDRPSFGNTSRFIDGGAHPGYFIPALHDAWAMIAAATQQHVLDVLWLMPVITLPVAVLAYAGLAFTLFRSHVAAFVGGTAWLLLAVVSTSPNFLPIAGGALPGNVAFDIVIPLAIACWVTSLQERDQPARRRAATVLTVATLAIAVLHANYLFHLALAIGGYLLFFALGSPWRREVWKRHLAGAARLLLVAGAALGLLLPILSRLEKFGRGTGQEETQGILERWSTLLVDSSSGYHLLPAQLLHHGGLAIAGTLCLLLALTLIRQPATWTIAGTGTLVVLVSQSDHLFPLLVGAGNTSMLLRLDRIMPHAMALTLGLLSLGLVVDTVRSQGGPVRVATSVFALSAAGLLAWLSWRYPFGAVSYSFPTADRSFPAWPVQLVELAALLALVVSVVLVIVRLVRDAPAGPAPDIEQSPWRALSTPAVAISVAVLIVGAAPALTRAALELPGVIRERGTDATASGHMQTLPDELREAALTEFEPGAVVLAEPRTAYQLMALAPVYVVADYKTWLGDTAAARADERLDEVTGFYGRSYTNNQRWRLVIDARVDYLVVERQQQHLLRFAAGEWFTPIVESDRIVVFRVANPRKGER